MKKKTAIISIPQTPAALQQDILNNLHFQQGRIRETASLNDWYMAVAHAVRDQLMKHWIDSLEKIKFTNFKLVGYLSAEFLVGPHLGNAIINLGIEKEVKEALVNLELDYHKILLQEEEPGLGNGGLGRLAACYLDSMASLQVPAFGYGIRYEFGIFDQRIVNGEQVEITDKWLRYGNPWEIPRTETTYHVSYGGQTVPFTDEEGNYRVKWIPAIEIKGVAYDTPVPGYKNNFVSLLRLWKSEPLESFDFSEFNSGNYEAAVSDKVFAETISKVLYPNDEKEAGKKLRLMQQYFFVSCSLQDTLDILKLRRLAFKDIPTVVALQLNDTHPSVAIAELMRLLVDVHQLPWEEAWQLTQQTFGYTNHTLLPEALEKWPVALFQTLLPRHMEIVYEINQRFLDAIRKEFPGQPALLSRLSVIDESGERYVRMAHLASIGSHCINGVSKLHTELLKRDVLNDFNFISPGKFVNVTNGVTPRRWIKLYNPDLAELITSHIGEKWVTNLETEFARLEALANDADFQKSWQEVKKNNKKALADHLMVSTGVLVNPDSLFDIQVKRIHEYKRQHLNLLHIITLFNQVKKNPAEKVVPRTFIFGGKAAPGYYQAKLIIRLINAVAAVVNNDLDVAGRIKIVFYPDYNVKNSEWVYRAADLSEQISTAGKEASGTGNMKFSLNGALTIGTLDGANVEMREAVGADNFFLFGMTADEVSSLKARGYRPRDFYESNVELKEAIDLVDSGYFSGGNGQVYRPFTDVLLNSDPYFVLADYAAYMACQQEVSKAYKNKKTWTKKSILNVARMGYFSSDRSIRDYCKNVWDINVKA